MNNLKTYGHRTSLVIKPRIVIFPLLVQRLDQERFLDQRTRMIKDFETLLGILLLKDHSYYSVKVQIKQKFKSNKYFFAL